MLSKKITMVWDTKKEVTEEFLLSMSLEQLKTIYTVKLLGAYAMVYIPGGRMIALNRSQVVGGYVR